MGIRSWFAELGQKATQRRRQEGFYSSDLIADQVPELAGKSDVEGMAYTLEEIEKWRLMATSDQWREIRRRQSESIARFEADGLVMPYWGNLWLLRTYQHELGLSAPWVAPTLNSDYGNSALDSRLRELR